MVWTTSEVAKKTNSTQSAVRYFARKMKLPKRVIKKKSSFVFRQKDVTAYKKHLTKQRKQQQLHFDFYNDAQTEKRNIHSDIILLLQRGGKEGVQRKELMDHLRISSEYRLDSLLADLIDEPIFEDDRIDDRLYWLGG